MIPHAEVLSFCQSRFACLAADIIVPMQFFTASKKHGLLIAPPQMHSRVIFKELQDPNWSAEMDFFLASDPRDLS